jgi:CDP-diacylglycerol--glycerol-3-phosphate 3-phosphatidyltransferase
MFDGRFRQGVDRVTAPVGRGLVAVGLTANVLTGVGLAMAVVAAVVIGSGHLAWGIVAMVGSGLPDLLDGPVAKAAGTTSRRGAFFDSVADRAADFALYGGLAWYLAARHEGTVALVPFGLAAAASLVSYERAKAELLGIPARGGLMERAERFVALGICLLAGAVDAALLVPFLVGFLVLVSATALGRFARVWRGAGEPAAVEPPGAQRPVPEVPVVPVARPAVPSLLAGMGLGAGLRASPRGRLDSRWRAWRVRHALGEERGRVAGARRARSAGWRAGGAEPARRWRLRRGEPGSWAARRGRRAERRVAARSGSTGR